MDFLAVSGSGIGLWVADGPKPIVYNRTGATVAIGDVVMFDMAATDGSVLDTASQGTSGDILANVINPATAGLGEMVAAGVHPGYWFAAVIDLLDGAGATGTQIRVQLWGRFKIKTPDLAVTGDALYPVNGTRVLSETAANGNKCLAHVIEDNASGGVALRTVIFNGLGFGNVYAS